MMTLCEPVTGDIWLAYLEFADHPSVGKVRPVVIVDVKSNSYIALAVKVTSKNLKAHAEIPCVPIENWKQCGLVKPSYIRLDQIFEIAFENLLRSEPLGKLPESYMNTIASLINTGF